jgi:SpoIID/LytB domain protein
VTRSSAVRAAVALVTAGVALSAAVVPTASVAGTTRETYRVPPGGIYTVHGHGFGHGRGMSQWGAYGAAKVGNLSTNQILHFYYPHTTLATYSTKRQLRVLLSAAAAASTGHLAFAPASGLAVTPAGGTASVLPATSPAPGSHPITRWRLVPAGAALTLQGLWQSRWHTVTRRLAAPVGISDRAAAVPVVEPAGGAAIKTVRYRGVVQVELQSGNLEAVNVVGLELYLRSVVPAEMPASWTAAALRAQAVAARTYAWYGVRHPKASWFDVFGDTRDQGYGGIGSEATRTSRAIHDTAGEVIVDSAGAPILAQYSSANGGWTVSGGVSYLPARRDPYDGAVPNSSHAWTVTLPAARIAAAFPAAGRVTSLVITGRDGHGAWGGRVTTMTVVGTKRSVSVSGAAFALALGLRSAWFRPTPPPGPPQRVHATASGRAVTVTWKPPAPIAGAAPVTGYRIRITPKGPSTRVAASTLSATLSQAPLGTDTVTVAALSAAGRGPGAATTVVVKAGQ